jgi:hypothetical protein
VALRADPQRIAVTVDTAFQTDPDFQGSVRGPLGPDAASLTVSAVLADADGRLFRTPTATGSLTKAGQRLVLPIVDLAPADATGPIRSLRPTGPLRLDAIELTMAITDPVPVIGSAELKRVEVTSAADGDAGWTTLAIDPSAPGWQWRQVDAEENVAYSTAPDRPGLVAISRERPLFGGGFTTQGSTTFRLGAGLPEDLPLPAIASAAFLEASGSAIGDRVGITSLGVPLEVRIVASTDVFAPLDPAVPFLVTDLAASDSIQLAATGQTRQADEWWLGIDTGQASAVISRLREPSASARVVIGREELTRSLSTDPVPLGLIGVLGLGSLAAMLFAGIGFLVSSTVSTSERLGEFALLRALGLSAGQLALWLSIESIFLLVVGLAAGSLLGLVLARLVLPFATLTQTGVAPVPAPVVVVPWEAIVPVYLAAVVLFVLSIWLVRRQLPDVRIGGVLRAGQG